MTDKTKFSTLSASIFDELSASNDRSTTSDISDDSDIASTESDCSSIMPELEDISIPPSIAEGNHDGGIDSHNNVNDVNDDNDDTGDEDEDLSDLPALMYTGLQSTSNNTENAEDAVNSGDDNTENQDDATSEHSSDSENDTAGDTASISNAPEAVPPKFHPDLVKSILYMAQAVLHALADTLDQPIDIIAKKIEWPMDNIIAPTIEDVAWIYRVEFIPVEPSFVSSSITRVTEGMSDSFKREIGKFLSFLIFNIRAVYAKMVDYNADLFREWASNLPNGNEMLGSLNVNMSNTTLYFDPTKAHVGIEITKIPK